MEKKYVLKKQVQCILLLGLDEQSGSEIEVTKELTVKNKTVILAVVITCFGKGNWILTEEKKLSTSYNWVGYRWLVGHSFGKLVYVLNRSHQGQTGKGQWLMCVVYIERDTKCRNKEDIRCQWSQHIFNSLEVPVWMLHFFLLSSFTFSSQSTGNSAWHMVGVW